NNFCQNVLGSFITAGNLSYLYRMDFKTPFLVKGILRIYNSIMHQNIKSGQKVGKVYCRNTLNNSGAGSGTNITRSIISCSNQGGYGHNLPKEGNFYRKLHIIPGTNIKLIPHKFGPQIKSLNF